MLKKGKDEYLLNSKRCKQCTKIIPYEKRYNSFCNSSCSASFTNKGVRRHGLPKDAYEKNCINCNTKTYNLKFCSQHCEHEYKWSSIKKQIENGSNSFGERTYKKYLKEKYGNICSICKNTEWTNKPIPLILDHIDGDSNNNILSNFRLVCPNCDALSPTYAGRNSRKGRSNKNRTKYRRNRKYE